MSEKRVLIMDDEAFLMEVMGSMLEIIGYDSDYASNGTQAIELYQQALTKKTPYAFIIMDLTIPGGMGAKETIKELRVIDPEVRAIVSSGYANDPIMTDYSNHGFAGVITKPFKLDDLKAVVEQVTR